MASNEDGQADAGEKATKGAYNMKKIRVGAAQISPHFFDKQKTLDKT